MKYLLLAPLLLTGGCELLASPPICPDVPPATLAQQEQVDSRCQVYPRLSPADPKSNYWDVGGQEWGLGQEGVLDAPGRAWIMGQVWPISKKTVIDNLGEPKHFTQASLTYKWENRWVTVFCEATPSPEAPCYAVKEGD
jgi:hypothetical protein